MYSEKKIITLIREEIAYWGGDTKSMSDEELKKRVCEIYKVAPAFGMTARELLNGLYL